MNQYGPWELTKDDDPKEFAGIALAIMLEADSWQFPGQVWCNLLLPLPHTLLEQAHINRRGYFCARLYEKMWNFFFSQLKPLFHLTTFKINHLRRVEFDPTPSVPYHPGLCYTPAR
jgi:hypothetical protein